MGVLVGFIGLHVDDGLVMGTDSFIKNEYQEFGKIFDIKPLDSTPFKYLGGVVSQKCKGEPIVIDYTHHIKKLRTVSIPRTVDGKSFPIDTPLPPKLHSEFRS